MHCWIIEVGIKAGLQRPLGEQQSDLGLGINWKIASGILGIPAHLFCAAHTVFHLGRLHRTWPSRCPLWDAIPPLGCVLPQLSHLLSPQGGVCQGSPKITLRPDDSLEELTEHRKAFIPVVRVYYSKRMQIKINKEKKYTGQSPGETKCKIPGVPSQQSGGDVLDSPGSSVWEHVQSTASRGSSPKPWCPGFYWGIYLVVMLFCDWTQLLRL